jgi:hypothetical protein
MSSPEPESSAQPGATVEGGDVPLQGFRTGLSDIKRYAEIDARYDRTTQFDVTKINNELTEPPPPYSAGDSAAQTEISEELLKIQSRVETDAMDHLASQHDMTQIEQLTESRVPDADDRQARIARALEGREAVSAARAAHEANTAGQDADDIGRFRSFPGYLG